MAKKTYGVKGLIEWHALIPFGKSAMSVKFTGGTLSGYGISPAKFTTSDKIAQSVIENSALFKSGKIMLMAVYEEPGDKAGALADKKAETKVKLYEVKVASIDDAKEYLMEKFKISWTKLRTQDAIMQAGKANGVQFIIGE
ncbi:MAG: hypothetical protein J6V00_05205 [Bacteroidaceae bacterium]|nr:hypothetical protein [Bacteroidaceae bacterium]